MSVKDARMGRIRVLEDLMIAYLEGVMPDMFDDIDNLEPKERVHYRLQMYKEVKPRNISLLTDDKDGNISTLRLEFVDPKKDEK